MRKSEAGEGGPAAEELNSRASEKCNMKRQPFDRSKHVYKNEAFVELVKDAVRFFNGTPVHELPPAEKFTGTGVYALYYTGKHIFYAQYAKLNRLAYTHPIYVGKAVPKGWRQFRTSDRSDNQLTELYSRLREHSRNIAVAEGIEVNEFSCRFVIFEEGASDMISTIEAALIKLNRPLWNSVVDGFGNHTPGAGRFEQAKSDWDVIHPGRAWAEKCMGVAKDKESIVRDIKRHFKDMRKPDAVG